MPFTISFKPWLMKVLSYRSFGLTDNHLLVGFGRVGSRSAGNLADGLTGGNLAAVLTGSRPASGFSSEVAGGFSGTDLDSS